MYFKNEAPTIEHKICFDPSYDAHSYRVTRIVFCECDCLGGCIIWGLHSSLLSDALPIPSDQPFLPVPPSTLLLYLDLGLALSCADLHPQRWNNEEFKLGFYASLDGNSATPQEKKEVDRQ